MQARARDVTAAILVWLPDGARPRSGDFRGNPSAEVFPSFADAVERAMVDGSRHAGGLPWVKVGSRIFDPDQIRRSCGTVRDVKGRSRHPA
jgi:hypothetical protein